MAPLLLWLVPFVALGAVARVPGQSFRAASDLVVLHAAVHDDRAAPVANLYPRAQAQTLAKMNKEGVMTTDGDLESGKLARMSAPPEPARPTPEPMPMPETAPSPTPAPIPSPEPMAPGMNMEAQAADGSSARTELPRTATEAPLLLAIGMGAFFAGLALVVRRRRA